MTPDELTSMLASLRLRVDALESELHGVIDMIPPWPPNEYEPPEKVFNMDGGQGYLYVGGHRFYDSDLTSDTTGTAITDNSNGAKTWTVVNISEVYSGTFTVTYETGPPPHPLPDNQEWYETALQIVPIHLPRL